MLASPDVMMDTLLLQQQLLSSSSSTSSFSFFTILIIKNQNTLQHRFPPLSFLDYIMKAFNRPAMDWNPQMFCRESVFTFIPPSKPH